jgi:hypothetical protein
MNRRSFFTVIASFLLCLIFKPASGQTQTRRSALPYPQRQEQPDKRKTDTGLENDKIIISRSDEAAITPALSNAPNVSFSYDRFENITRYGMKSVVVRLPTDYWHYTSIPLGLQAYFSCRGDSGERPCTPSNILLTIDHWLLNNSYSYENLPFNYQYRDIIILADGKRVVAGRMNVEIQTRLSDVKILIGAINISLPAFRQIANAQIVEMRIGKIAISLPSESNESLASFYNFATINRRTPTINTRRSPANRRN